jgi:hypothetical protein
MGEPCGGFFLVKIYILPDSVQTQKFVEWHIQSGLLTSYPEIQKI